MGAMIIFSRGIRTPKFQFSDKGSVDYWMGQPECCLFSLGCLNHTLAMVENYVFLGQFIIYQMLFVV